MMGVAAAMVMLAASPVGAAPIDGEKVTQEQGSGLPVPRFASLSASEVNMRSGPGERYPIDWVYKRNKLPIEIIQEFGDWRKVRDADGTEGWMLSNLLSSDRTALIRFQTRVLYAEPDANGRKVWRAEPGVVGDVIICDDAWCQLSFDGKTGWILREHIWGTYPGENFN
jgi:SH3-like domain-containing protein